MHFRQLTHSLEKVKPKDVKHISNTIFDITFDIRNQNSKFETI